MIAAIEDPPVIRKILTHLGLSAHRRFAIHAPLAVLPVHPCTGVRTS